MDVFQPVWPKDRWHPNFTSAMTHARSGEREVIQSWAEDFPDRDGKMASEFQTTFNSSFWELYLHGLFKDYGFGMTWQHAAPDFHLTTSQGQILVEAVTANAASGATPEWEKPSLMTRGVAEKDFWPLNREAIIRLSNSVNTKIAKYRKSYEILDHVKGKPFVIAIAPFEQPDFQFQYDRPIRALLYDDYVDEAAYYESPERFPNGPPTVALGFVEKNANVCIDLGLFRDDSCREVSAVLFSCVATWGKAVALSRRPAMGSVRTMWGGPDGPYPRVSRIGTPSERLSDGLQVFHNPYARHPIDPSTFRGPGIVQHYVDSRGYVHENYDDCLHFRNSMVLTPVAPEL